MGRIRSDDRSDSLCCKRIDEVWARLDLRTDWEHALDVLVGLAQDSGAVWIGGDSQERTILGRGRAALVEAVTDSDAARFAANPRAFLEGVAKGEA